MKGFSGKGFVCTFSPEKGYAATGLAGVRYAPAIAGKLLEKAVAQMKESMTYQKILADGREEGKAEGERVLFLKLARRRLGEPDAQVLATVQVASSENIELWAESLDRVESWGELLKG